MDVRQARAAQLLKDPSAVPCGAGRTQPFKAEIRSKTVKFEGRSYVQLEGYASVVEEPYEMYDWLGPYSEIVDRNAFDTTLKNEPDVSFLMNHRGVTMARTTRAGRLTLAADDTGLSVLALVNPEREDVRTMLTAIEDGDITEMSFAFQIVRGKWSPDYEEFRIKEVDLDRGDVSAVNYGANPYTNIAARSTEILEALEHLPVGAARAAIDRLRKRGDIGQMEIVGEHGPELVRWNTNTANSSTFTITWRDDESDDGDEDEPTQPVREQKTSADTKDERARTSYLAAKTAYPELFEGVTK